jgi:hypothetical protein
MEKSFGRAQHRFAVPVTRREKPAITNDPRRTKRVRTYLKGKLVFGDGAFTIDCAICDLSPAGARVRAAPGLFLSESVYLVLVRNRAAFEALVRWRRRDGSLGLKFQARHDLNAPNREDLKVLRRYCIDASFGGSALSRS